MTKHTKERIKNIQQTGNPTPVAANANPIIKNMTPWLLLIFIILNAQA